MYLKQVSTYPKSIQYGEVDVMRWKPTYCQFTLSVETQTYISLRQPPGADGQDGAPGAIVYYGSVEPASDLGKPGDFYINTATGEIFAKTEASWALAEQIAAPVDNNETSGLAQLVPWVILAALLFSTIPALFYFRKKP